MSGNAKVVVSLLDKPAGSYFVRIDACFKGICKEAPDAVVAAAVLARMEYWQGIKIAHLPITKRMNALEAAGQDADDWVYKSATEMQAELLGMFGLNAIKAAFAWLVKSGYLLRRTNPKNKMDKTYQYRLDLPLVQSALSAWGASDDGLNLNDGRLDLNDAAVKSNLAIPKKVSKEEPQTITGAWVQLKAGGTALSLPTLVPLPHAYPTPPQRGQTIIEADGALYQWLTPLGAFATLFYDLRPDMPEHQSDAIWDRVNQKAKKAGWWAKEIQAIDTALGGITTATLVGFKHWLVKAKRITEIRAAGPFAIRLNEYLALHPQARPPAPDCLICNGSGVMVISKADPVLGGVDKSGPCTCTQLTNQTENDNGNK